MTLLTENKPPLRLKDRKTTDTLLCVKWVKMKNIGDITCEP